MLYTKHSRLVQSRIGWARMVKMHDQVCTLNCTILYKQITLTLKAINGAADFLLQTHANGSFVPTAAPKLGNRPIALYGKPIRPYEKAEKLINEASFNLKMISMVFTKYSLRKILIITFLQVRLNITCLIVNPVLKTQMTLPKPAY